VSGTRIPAKGERIDRAKTIRFQFNGRTYQGFAGDTLASALLASGESLFSRSWKYHRPRGIVTSGIEEPSGPGAVRKRCQHHPQRQDAGSGVVRRAARRKRQRLA